jgi:hypothetical protein
LCDSGEGADGERYLIFSEDSVIPLDKYVLTTEAHPLAIFTE